MGVALGLGAGERTIAGDPAPDEEARPLERAACADGAALAVVRTDCGNATLVGFAWRDGRWAPRSHLAVVDAGRPGHCVQSVALVTPVSLSVPGDREVVVESESTSDDGDAGERRTLRVARLSDDGALAWYEGAVPMGSFDEATGATTEGRWDVIAELPLPRDLYVEQRPAHGGLAGQPVGREIRRETWRVRGLALVRVDVTRERVVDPAPPRPPPRG
jgi:hypothetical protein